MDILLATARRLVSDLDETRFRGERRRSPSKHRGRLKKHCRSGIRLHRAEYPCNRRGQLTELFRLLAAQNANPAQPKLPDFGN
jgi:hypothetical protein